MKALARFGKAFGGYKMIDVPEPVCGPDDVVIEIKAAAICGADMKHYNVDSGSEQFNSIRGHEFAGQIVQVGDKVKDWKVGQRVVSDNSGHVCGVCPACEQGDFLCCTEKVNLGLQIYRSAIQISSRPGCGGLWYRSVRTLFCSNGAHYGGR